MTTRDADEILEIIWMEKEKGKKDLCIIEEDIRKEKLQDMLEQMKKDGWLKVENGEIDFTLKGEKAASGLIRRHRLAERLLIDVLETNKDELEDSACQFEHILSEEVTDAICTLLGHPKECPHGLLIPAGHCCQKAGEVVEILVTSLEKLEVGETAAVAYILTRNHPRLHKLMSFGIAPGIKIKMHQKFPSYIIQVEETQIALEKEVINDIYVRKTG
ncbi:metal-dependent transcriptional regulator [Candidatus Saganbacteria bacterium]|uniref:Metal-dependent transcriptional regulator n=1 Tax=Candidatus Saganbacteria bacterium TaxID=2575572 RepID=A0A9D6UMV8_UNCSA|nr:metal-dependent transcriptional regulator [Candidatus Saganbacteria bacterium]